MKIKQHLRESNETICSISITTEEANIMEFIHIFDRNGKRMGHLSILNRSNGNTEIDYTRGEN